MNNRGYRHLDRDFWLQTRFVSRNKDHAAMV
jgi:hypothetical protein